MAINTKRLILRPWTEEDLEPFAKLNADARVREYFPALLSCQESDASVKLASEHIQRCGWGQNYAPYDRSFNIDERRA